MATVHAILEQALPAQFLLDPSEVVVGRIIGMGGFAAVQECTFRGQRCAVKVFPADRIDSVVAVTIANEAAKLAGLQQPPNDHVIVFYGAAATEDGSIMLVMELMSRGSLARAIPTLRTADPMRRLRLYRNILRALVFLHEHGLAHLDLKPENVLLADGDCAMKLCDFNISKATYVGQSTLQSAIPGAGTRRYMAPEQWASGAKVTLAADLYAFGMLCAHMELGVHPLAGLSEAEIERFLTGQTLVVHRLPPQLRERSMALYQLVCECLSFDATQRPTSALALQCLDGLLMQEDWTQERATWQQRERALTEELASARARVVTLEGALVARDTAITEHKAIIAQLRSQPCIPYQPHLVLGRNGIGAEGVRSQATAFVARDLKAQGHTARDLTSAGFTMDDLKAAGFTISELRATGIAPLKAPVLSHRTDHPVITNPFAFTDDDDDGWPQRAKWSEEKKARGKPEAEAVETHDHLSPQKMILGDRLYSLVNHHQPQWAPKITGMLLEMEISEILHLIENPETLAEAIREATAILQQVGYNELNDVTIGYR